VGGFTRLNPRTWRPDDGNRDGTALTEFVLCLPFLLMLFCGMIEYGFMIATSMLMIDATREAAYYGAKGKTCSEISVILSKYVPRRNLISLALSIIVKKSNGTVTTVDSRDTGASLTVQTVAAVQWLTPLSAFYGQPTYPMYCSSTFRCNR
jgi:Flp pilus assembly protein TadG